MLRSSACLLQLGLFFGKDGPLHGTNLQADAAIDAGVEVDPIKVCALAVGALAGVDASHGAGINAIGYALADVGDDRVSHLGILRSDPEGTAAAAGLAEGFSFRLVGAGAAEQFGAGAHVMQGLQLI